MTSRGPVAVFVATSVTLAAYLFPHFALPGVWWRGIPAAAVILLTGALFFGRDMPRVYGLSMSARSVALSVALLAALLPAFSWALRELVLVSPLTAERYDYPLAHVHQFFQVFNDEVVLRAALLTILLAAFPHPRLVIFGTAVLFAVAHHVVYRPAAFIDWPALLTIFAFAGIANTLFVRFGHIGYGFALHLAWNLDRFNSWYSIDGVPLTEGNSFNYVEGNRWVVALSIATFGAVWATFRKTLPDRDNSPLGVLR